MKYEGIRRKADRTAAKKRKELTCSGLGGGGLSAVPVAHVACGLNGSSGLRDFVHHAEGLLLYPLLPFA